MRAPARCWALSFRMLFLYSMVSLVTLGCKKTQEFGQVSGTVTMGGKPMDMVRVQFMPEPSKDSTAAHSDCITGKDGRFELSYSRDAEIHGAVVGWHRVVLEDIAAQSRGEPRPIRIPDEYSSSARTPLRMEVKPGPQTFELTVEKKR